MPTLFDTVLNYALLGVVFWLFFLAPLVALILCRVIRNSGRQTPAVSTPPGSRPAGLPQDEVDRRFAEIAEITSGGAA